MDFPYEEWRTYPPVPETAAVSTVDYTTPDSVHDIVGNNSVVNIKPNTPSTGMPDK
jgi:hypothetical protein